MLFTFQMTLSLCFHRPEFNSSLEKCLENYRKFIKYKSLMLHLGGKSQVNEHQVVNNWVCSSMPGKDLGWNTVRYVEGGDQSSFVQFRKGKDMRKNNAINLPVIQFGTWGKSFEL